MSGAGAAGPDLLEGGGPERPRRVSGPSVPSRTAGWVSDLVRAHRRLTGAVAVVLAAVAWFGFRWYDDRPPATPDVTVSDDRSADSVPLWSPARDGRPGSPVTLSVSAKLSAPDGLRSGPLVTAIGLAGPGVSAPGVFPHGALGRVPSDFDLTGQVACDQVPLPLPSAAYDIQLQVQDGSRTALDTVPLRSAQSAIARRVTFGCSTWLAARDLTVTAVHAVVDPTLPRVDLTVQITNAGSRDGLVWLGDIRGTGVRVTAVRAPVPGHRTVAVSASVDLDYCPSWSQAARPVTATDTPFQLLGAVGVSEPLPADAVPLSQGTNGVVLAPVPAEQLQDAFVEACGGVSSPVLLTAQGSSHYDAAARVLTARVLADLPPGVVTWARFAPAVDAGTDIVPLFRSSPWLAPDASGQVTWTLRFSVPDTTVPCLGGGPFIPVTLQARVPASNGAERVIEFQLAAETLLPPVEIEAACTVP